MAADMTTQKPLYDLFFLGPIGTAPSAPRRSASWRSG